MVFNKKKDATGGNYKFKSLQVFGSKEGLYKNERKYRKVFDATESGYLYCEFAFYNKLFDEDDWEADVRLVCKDVEGDKQLCDLKKHYKISKDQNIFHSREGWGTPNPGWWKKGKYYWQVWIDGVSVGTTYFYVVDGGLVKPGVNPYFKINSIKLFESQRNGLAKTQRKYLKTFNTKTARYINIEMELTNLQTEKDLFPIEMQFNFYNDSGQHKAYMSYFKEITDKRTQIHFDTGYGAQTGGYWYKDKYNLEVLYMDQLIAVIPFEVADEEEEKTESFPVMSGPSGKPIEVEKPKPALTFEEAKAELEALIGLGDVKKQINELSTYLQFIKIREKKGFDESEKFALNSVFIGNPGTGKTTVARMLGKIYNSLELLSNGKVHEVGRADLVGEFIGQTAPKVKKVIEKARGGILFIDEAYALTDRGTDGKDFGKEVVEVLLKELSDGPGDLAIICAGYPKEMQQFLNSNPGMASRLRNVINFPDYTPDELIEIGEFSSEKKGVVLEESAKEELYKKIVEEYRTRDKMFGNARFVNGIIDEAKQNMALRLMDKYKAPGRLSNDKLSTITLADVSSIFKDSSSNIVKLPVDEALLSDCMQQLHELIGLEEVKKEVDEMVKLVRYYKEIGKDVKKAFSIHTVFKGNPGTGKTTVARLIVRIYKALGILEKGHLVECDRKDLVAGFVGQTAIKTSERIDQAIGGGLFIDEAYALTQGGGTDFGKEVIETLLKRMEDQRGEFMVIVAGYPEEMGVFLEANPGLMSRFDKQFIFEDFTNKELMDIAVMMFDEEDLKMDASALERMQQYIDGLMGRKHKYFGNARTIRKIIHESIRKQHIRMAEMDSEARTKSIIKTVTALDISGFKLIEEESERKGIGFRTGE